MMIYIFIPTPIKQHMQINIFICRAVAQTQHSKGTDLFVQVYLVKKM